MRVALKNAINHLLRPLNRQLVHKNELDYKDHQFMNVVKEFEGCFQELVFPDLPTREGRAELMIQLAGTQVAEAFYLLQYLHRSLESAGDVCEFGIGCGATSALIAHELQETDRNLWLFDSFKGLAKPTEKDLLIDDILNLVAIERYEGMMAYEIKEVVGRLKTISFPLHRVKIVPGFIEETILLSDLPEKVSFAYVDFDFYEPILIALNFLDGCLSDGGAVVVDDYGFFSSGAKTAVDEFVATHTAKYELVLPCKFAGHFAVLSKIK